MPRSLNRPSNNLFRTADGAPWHPCKNGILPLAQVLDSFADDYPHLSSWRLEQRLRANGRFLAIMHWLEANKSPAHADRFEETVLAPFKALKKLEDEFKEIGIHGGFCEIENLLETELALSQNKINDQKQYTYYEDLKIEFVEKLVNITDQANEAAIYCRNIAAIIESEMATGRHYATPQSDSPVSQPKQSAKKRKPTRGKCKLEDSDPGKYRLYHRIVKAIDSRRILGSVDRQSIASDLNTDIETVRKAARWHGMRLSRQEKGRVK